MIMPRVTCAICQKPVERLEGWYDHSTRENVLKAYCHGDTDTMKVDLLRLKPELAKQLVGAEGVAFSVKRIADVGVQHERSR